MTANEKQTEYKGYPAPWKYGNWNTRKNILIGVSIPIGVRDLDIKLPITHVSEDECPNAKCCNTKEHATALLISFAPDMLEMLQKCTCPGDIHELQNEIHLLISKATTL